jgi:hypothetical protein
LGSNYFVNHNTTKEGRTEMISDKLKAKHHKRYLKELWAELINKNSQQTKAKPIS